MRFGKRIACLLLAACLLGCLAPAGGSAGEQAEVLRVEDGMLQPILTWTNAMEEGYTNQGSDILRFCVWVETDYDTDLDGKADLVKAVVQVPRAAAEGKYRAAVIYDPTPYFAGTMDKYEEDVTPLYVEKPFHYADLYRECEKRQPAGAATALEAAEAAKPSQWMYVLPNKNGMGWSSFNAYDYFLVRGYAVVEAAGIGTYGSEGFELCGTKLERDSHKNVVEWLTGDRRAFTNRTDNVEIRADWCSGSVAMTGTSYGGTLAFEVAATGVKGLKTIIPVAGIASWYDYTNSQGVPLLNNVNYADSLAGYNCGGCFLDEEMEQLNPKYGSWLWQIAQDQAATNGDYAPVWEALDYTVEAENHFDCTALIVSGMNDSNVSTRHADLMFRAFRKAGKPVKLLLHQDGHNDLNYLIIDGTPWQELMNKWLAHYLYGVENDVESLPEVLAQSNVDGSYRKYAGWLEAERLEAKAVWTEESTLVSSAGLGQYLIDYQENIQSNLTPEEQIPFLRTLKKPMAAVYPLEVAENTTLFGVPEVRVKLSSEQVDLDGLMITAALVDVSDQGTFPAYVTHHDEGNLLRRRSLERLLAVGGGLADEFLQEYETDNVPAKGVSLGWTDLQNPNGGFDSSGYTLQEGLAAEGDKIYTFYMMPTVYTLAPGHHLELILTTWDPYRVFLDENFQLDASMSTKLDSYDYAYTVDNASLKVTLPVAKPAE